MTLPNLISLARLLAVPVVVWAILAEEMALAFWLFIAAGVSPFATCQAISPLFMSYAVILPYGGFNNGRPSTRGTAPPPSAA